MKRHILILLMILPVRIYLMAQNQTGNKLVSSQVLSLNGEGWSIATDPENKGREEGWFQSPPVADSRKTTVPWIIQDVFPEYHGVVWYWREFETPPNLHRDGRTLLKFLAVDYLAEVWINGKSAGGHEGGETPFETDVTELLRAGEINLLVVRVLNPAYSPIDGISLKDTPSGAKNYPYGSNAAYNSGGIVGDVELLMTPSIRLTRLILMPDWKTGRVRVQASVLNTGRKNMKSVLNLQVTEARTGRVKALMSLPRKFHPGGQSLELETEVHGFRKWSPDDPSLYSVTLSLQTNCSVDQQTLRCGFRDFRFDKGYFRLNGERIYLIGSNFSTHYPVGYTVPLNEDMLRRDVINMKALGFNFVRIPFGCPNSRVLDIYDELGILVQQEHFGSWQMGQYGTYEYPGQGMDKLTERFETSVREVVLRDRHHASVVMWGLLNENKDDGLFRKAVEMLPSLRNLDPFRMFVLNSGRFDKVKEIGSMSNPGSVTWDVGYDELYDWHPYVWMPYSSKTLDDLSGRSATSGRKAYISETGLCFPLDLPSELGDYQLRGKENSEDALYFRRQYEKFMADWNWFDMGSCWARADDYIRDAWKTAASLREIAETAIRSNPFVVSYTPTNSVADNSPGESVATNFRRLKPEMIGSVLQANSSLRWCLRTEPQSIYRGDKIRLMVSFSSLDVLKPGNYPATVRVVDPSLKTVFERKVQVAIPEKEDGRETPFAQSILSEEITLEGQPGKYQLLAVLERGGTATGGKTEFYVSDRNDLPSVTHKVVVCGSDSLVTNWLRKHHTEILPFQADNQSERQLILIAGKAPDSLTMINIVRQMACGSVVIFLSPATFSQGRNSTRWLPLAQKGVVEPMDAVAGYYRSDRWAKKHPVFEGMPSGGMMDYVWFRNIIAPVALSRNYSIRGKGPHTFDEATSPLTVPSETICGATRICHTYCSGIHLGIWEFGQGRFIVNTLYIAENLGKDPAADRLFCNLLNYAMPDFTLPVTPSDFDRQLEEIGFR